MDKHSLRQSQRAWRGTVPSKELTRGVSEAAVLLAGRPEWKRARTIALYAALPGEPDLSGLAAIALEENRRVAYPITPRRDAPLAWREHRHGVAMVAGRFRVPVPPPDAATVRPEDIDLVVVPALAVDARGFRLGYGGGFYDRTLPTLIRAFSVWLGLEAQVLPHIPTEPTDRPVDALVTPAGWRMAHR